ncbi:MAG TPA: serine/threonine-protein kinase, partial [Trebonia sp.]|nr:serine/threonine-protein kinase [Trebonia sp.]
TDLVLHREVAVKLLLPQFAEDAQSAARFRAEARHAGRVSHPNIAQIFDYSEGHGSSGDAARSATSGKAAKPAEGPAPDDAEGLSRDDKDPADDSADGSADGSASASAGPVPSHLVMELVDGPSLAALLADGPVGLAYTLSVLAQVGAGLAAAHAHDLVHRDIKPANLLISTSGLVKITDFGIAYAAAAAPITRTGEVVGTCSYMAPERTRGGQVGPAADLYSLGIVAYECLTGERPFRGEPLAILLAHQERPLPPFPPEVPEAIAAFVRELTAKDPAARPASAAEVAARAERLRAGLGGPTAVRTDLPVLVGTILTTTGAQPALGTVEATARPAEATRAVSAPAAAPAPKPVTEAASEATGGSSPRWWHRLSRRTGLSAGIAAMAVAVAAAAGLTFAHLSGQTSHSPSNRGASAVVKPAQSATPTSTKAIRSTRPSRGTVSNLSTAPAGTPVTPAVGPYGEGTSSAYYGYGSYPAFSESPAASAMPTASASPVQTQTQPAASATAQPTGGASPTQTGPAGPTG